MEEISAGGVLINGMRVLLLKKFNGDYVLPKGRIEQGESLEDTAIREVMEETGVKGKISEYLGNIHYNYRNMRNSRVIKKTVHWFLMEAEKINLAPQRSEGFIEAGFFPLEKALNMLKFDDEKMMVEDAMEALKGE